MAEKNPTGLSVFLGKNDTDVMNWFNMIERSGQSRSRWVGALLIAYTQHTTINTGNSIFTPLDQLPPVKETDNSSSAPFSKKGSKKGTYGSWSHKDINGEFTVGSIVFIKLSNKKTIAALKEIQSGEVPASYIARAMIRRGFTGGSAIVLPDPSVIEPFYQDDKVDLYEDIINQQLSEVPSTPPVKSVAIIEAPPTPQVVSETPNTSPITPITNHTPTVEDSHTSQVEPKPGQEEESPPPDEEEFNPFLSFI